MRNLRFRKAIAVVLISFLCSSVVKADTVFVSCRGATGSIEKIDSNGNISTFASGLGNNDTQGMAFDEDGNLFMASWNNTIEKFTPQGSRTTFASSGLSSPTGIAFNSTGYLYAANFVGSTIQKYAPSGNRTVFASGGMLYSSTDIVFDGSNNIYVANRYQEILKYDSKGVGSLFASVRGCFGLTFDNYGNLYASANYGGGTIYKIDANGIKSIFASYLPSGLTGLAFDSLNNLYVSNYSEGTITKINSSGQRSLFASGLNEPMDIVMQIPEPCTLSLLAIGAFLAGRKRK